MAADPNIINPITVMVGGAPVSASNPLPVTVAGAGVGTVTSVSVVTANGVSGSVATATTTPAITITLAAITPTSVVITAAADVKALDVNASVTGANVGPSITIDVTWNTSGIADAFVIDVTNTASAANSRFFDVRLGGTSHFQIARGSTPGSLVSMRGALQILNATAIPAGGQATSGFKFSSTSNFGVFFGSGAPSISAAKGSLYLRSDGTGVNDRAYINTDGSTTWTALVTVG